MGRGKLERSTRGSMGRPGTGDSNTSMKMPGMGPWPASDRMRRDRASGSAPTSAAISETARGPPARTSGIPSLAAT